MGIGRVYKKIIIKYIIKLIEIYSKIIHRILKFLKPLFLVIYMEMNDRLGDKFLGCTPDIIIDGGYNPDTQNGSRLCVGSFSNAKRDDRITNIRQHIGDGIQLTAGPPGINVISF